MENKPAVGRQPHVRGGSAAQDPGEAEEKLTQIDRPTTVNLGIPTATAPPTTSSPP